MRKIYTPCVKTGQICKMRENCPKERKPLNKRNYYLHSYLLFKHSMEILLAFSTISRCIISTRIRIHKKHDKQDL